MDKDKSSIKKEEYDAFYKSIAHAADEPHLVLHNKNEELLNILTSYLFLLKDLDLFHPDRKTRVKLYVKKSL